MDYIKEMRAMMKMLSKEMPGDEFVISSESIYKKSCGEQHWRFYKNNECVSYFSDLEEMHDFLSEYVDTAHKEADGYEVDGGFKKEGTN